LESPPDRSDVVVDVVHRRIVGPAGPAHILDPRIPLVEAAHRAQSVAVRVHGSIGDLGMGGIGDGLLGESIPVGLRRFVGIVRVDERGDMRNGWSVPAAWFARFRSLRWRRVLKITSSSKSCWTFAVAA